MQKKTLPSHLMSLVFNRVIIAYRFRTAHLTTWKAWIYLYYFPNGRLVKEAPNSWSDLTLHLCPMLQLTQQREHGLNVNSSVLQRSQVHKRWLEVRTATVMRLRQTKSLRRKLSTFRARATPTRTVSLRDILQVRFSFPCTDFWAGIKDKNHVSQWLEYN